MSNALRCRLFRCPTSLRYQCCARCDKMDCRDRCANEPARCGYSTVSIDPAAVICPYFINHRKRNAYERNRLTCEGLINGTVDRTEFADAKKLGEHMAEFCCDRWEECVKNRCRKE